MTIAIQYPFDLYFYGPFLSVPGMARPRTIYGATHSPDCPWDMGDVIIADTPEAVRKLDAALNDCANFARNHRDAAPLPPAVWGDAAQWLTDREIRHAARMAGCDIIDADADAPLDPVREAAEARWRYHEENDTLDLY